MNKRMIEKLTRLKQANVDDLAHDIKNAIEHDYNQNPINEYRSIYVDKDNIILPKLRKYLIYEEVKTDRSIPFIYKLSYPLFLIFLIVVFLFFLPIKWFFTGRYTFRNHDNKFAVFIDNWFTMYN